jgi:hypothetical protein
MKGGSMSVIGRQDLARKTTEIEKGTTATEKETAGITTDATDPKTGIGNQSIERGMMIATVLKGTTEMSVATPDPNIVAGGLHLVPAVPPMVGGGERGTQCLVPAAMSGSFGRGEDMVGVTMRSVAMGGIGVVRSCAGQGGIRGLGLVLGLRVDD